MVHVFHFFSSLFSNGSSEANSINTLFLRYMILAGFIILLVTGLVIIGAFRYNAKKKSKEPKQVFGNKKLEMVWTILPLLAVTFFFFLTVQTMSEINRPHPSNESPDIVIVAHQWWWDMKYPKYNVETANELHIPVNKKLLAQIESADVIHDWWVPALGRKIDAVPGRKNYTWIDASKPGDYEGTCSEYCGMQHAWMRIKVIAESQNDFNKWIKSQQQIPSIANESNALKGEKFFLSNTCADCHAISGTPADANVGPNLTHFASRQTMLSGMMKNNDHNLKRWLTDPQKVKPGARMPNFILTKAEVNELAEYLEELK